MSVEKIELEHWSYTAMSTFLRNALAFKKKFILKVYTEDTYSPSSIVGQALHKVCEQYYSGFDLDVATKAGMDHMNKIPDLAIDFGKTGSRENMLKSFNQGITFFFEEIPDFYSIGDILAVEQKIITFLNVDGKDLAIPAKSYTDMIFRTKEGEIEINDWKFTTTYTDEGEYNWSYIIQAMFNYHTVSGWLQEKKYEGRPKRMIFREVKLSKNKDGNPQIQNYTIEYADHPEYFTLFYKLYDDCTRKLQGENIFLPNPSDMFDGDDTMLAYMQGLITSDLENVVVDHKEEVVKYTEKTYVESAHDKVENKFLTEEEKVRTKLQEFGIPVEMKETHVGANIILYTCKVSRGVKMSVIEKHDKDLALALKASSVRILAPILGTDLVGIEIPNPDRRIVPYPVWSTSDEMALEVPIGVDVFGNIHSKDLADMPHILIAGTTGGGKSVVMHGIIKSLTDKHDPEHLKLILIDPKRVEFSKYKTLPHLLDTVYYDEIKAARALEWAVQEMESRYEILEAAEARDIREYNKTAGEEMDRIVIIIDEFADLMLRDFSKDKMLSTPEISIVRIAQKARAVGIHLVIGTQRPSVDVITGLIKANMPTRIALMTTSGVDSRIILDQGGAEMLNGKGDMLFLDPSKQNLIRLQGFFL